MPASDHRRQLSDWQYNQRGEPRPGGSACDIGAIEFPYLRWRAYLPLLLHGE